LTGSKAGFAFNAPAFASLLTEVASDETLRSVLLVR
jgi:hypothetical protein